jgi:hypothetical protein
MLDLNNINEIIEFLNNNNIDFIMKYDNWSKTEVPYIIQIKKGVCLKCKKVTKCDLDYHDARMAISTGTIRLVGTSHGICADCK